MTGESCRIKLPAMEKKPIDITLYDTEDIVAAIRKGDEDVFSAFYIGYGDSILRLLMRVLGNMDDAKEVMQETFAYLWENRESIAPHTSLKGFVAGMAKNMAFRLLRSRIPVVVKQGNMQYRQRDFVDVVDGELISKETELLIKHVIGNMPPQRRKIFEMSREQGLTYNEIARQLNLSYGTVKNHMILALNDIRSILGAYLVLSMFASL